MNKNKILLSGLVILGVIVAVLMYNKSQMDAKSKNTIMGFVPVSVEPAVRRQMTNTHSLVGTVVGRNDVAIVSETQGKIVSVRAEVGDRVKAGTILMQADDELKKAAYEAAQVSYDKAKKDLERHEALLGQKSSTDAQLESARFAFKAAESQYILARRGYNDTRIASPIDGVITARPANVGTYVKSGDVVADVVDVSALKVKVSVNENDVFRLHTGEIVTVTTDVYPKATFTGKILTISDKGDESHTFPVEIGLANNAENPLRAGMFARVTFTSLGHEDILTIPRQALVGSVRKAQVFVVENAVAKLRDIIVDSEIGTVIEVLQGLREGEIVVTNGQNNLKDNMSIEIIK